MGCGCIGTIGDPGAERCRDGKDTPPDKRVDVERGNAIDAAACTATAAEAASASALRIRVMRYSWSCLSAWARCSRWRVRLSTDHVLPRVSNDLKTRPSICTTDLKYEVMAASSLASYFDGCSIGIGTAAVVGTVVVVGSLESCCLDFILEVAVVVVVVVMSAFTNSSFLRFSALIVKCNWASRCWRNRVTMSLITSLGSSSSFSGDDDDL